MSYMYAVKLCTHACTLSLIQFNSKKLHWHEILIKNMLSQLIHTVNEINTTNTNICQHMHAHTHKYYKATPHLHACTIKRHHASSVDMCMCIHSVQIMQQMKGQWKYFPAQSAVCGVYSKTQGEQEPHTRLNTTILTHTKCHSRMHI